MSFNWIKAEDCSFNSILLFDRWILRYFVGLGASGVGYYENAEYRKHLGIALAYNPTIRWYFEHKCPESKDRIAFLVGDTPQNLNQDDVRKSEIYVLNAHETFIIYVYPELMERNCAYIRDWTSDKLLSLVDFNDKVVLDIGSGTGRLAFAAIQKAKRVYAIEPVDYLREYMKDKILSENIKNLVVLDGIIENIPFEDSTFDIVMSAYVLGDNYEAEYAEMVRVSKSGGYIIDCDGEEDFGREQHNCALHRFGFECSHYISKNGGDVFRHWKKVIK